MTSTFPVLQAYRPFIKINGNQLQFVGIMRLIRSFYGHYKILYCFFSRTIFFRARKWSSVMSEFCSYVRIFLSFCSRANSHTSVRKKKLCPYRLLSFGAPRSLKKCRQGLKCATICVGWVWVWCGCGCGVGLVGGVFTSKIF